MLCGARVLIAEDEVLVADELAAAVERADGVVVGPVARVEDGLAMAGDARLTAAILDVQLEDGEVTRLAHSLLGRRLVVLFHTASPLPRAIVEVHGELPTCHKPMHPDHVILQLVAVIAARAG